MRSRLMSQNELYASTDRFMEFKEINNKEE